MTVINRLDSLCTISWTFAVYCTCQQGRAHQAAPPQHSIAAQYIMTSESWSSPVQAVTAVRCRKGLGLGLARARLAGAAAGAGHAGAVGGGRQPAVAA